MEDFITYENRKSYYENNKETFDLELEKLWRIFWEIEIVDGEYAMKLAKEYKNLCLDRVWLDRRKVFDTNKMPKEENLFKGNEWWFGQLVGKNNIKSTVEREKLKKVDAEYELLVDKTFFEYMDNHIEKVVDAVLFLKKICNPVMLASWFERDTKDPIIIEIFDEVCKGDLSNKIKKKLREKCKMIIDSKVTKEDTSLLSKFKPNKKTLVCIAAQFRFYYLGKIIAERFIFENESCKKKVFERAYLQPCPPDKLHIEDSIVAEELGEQPSQIKQKRNNAIDKVLHRAFKDKDYLDSIDESILESIYARRVWRYSNRNIQESLRINENICENIREEKNE